MGFKDVDRALSLNRDHGAGLSLAESAVLVVIAHHTKDATHQTIIGQQRIAAEVGCDVKTVQRAVGVLTLSGIISRQPRIVNGFKSTDTITFNHEWQGTVSRPTKSRQTQSRPTLRPASTDSPSPSGGLKVRAEENTQEITQVNTQIPSAEEQRDSLFQSLWHHWPRKAGKEEARKAFHKIAIADLDAVAIAIVAHGAAYAQWPKPEQQYVKHLSSWLNAKRWKDDELPLPRNGGTKTDAGRAAHEELMRRAALDEQKELTP